MFSGEPTQRMEPGSSNKRIRSRLRANCPYSLERIFRLDTDACGLKELKHTTYLSASKCGAK